jgi:hypothetical protein
MVIAARSRKTAFSIPLAEDKTKTEQQNFYTGRS